MGKYPKWFSFLSSLFVTFIFVIHEVHHDYTHKSPHLEIHDKIKILRREKNEMHN